MAAVNEKDIAKQQSKQSSQQSGATKEPQLPVPLEVMIGAGIEVDLYGQKFEIAPYLLSVAGRASKSLNACPLSIVAYGMAESVDDDLAGMVAILNKMTGRDGEDVLPNEAGQVQLDTLILNISEESVEPMLDAATLAIQRKHPTFTREDADRLIDAGNLLDVFRAIFQVNRSRRKRF